MLGWATPYLPSLNRSHLVTLNFGWRRNGAKPLLAKAGDRASRVPSHQSPQGTYKTSTIFDHYVYSPDALRTVGRDGIRLAVPLMQRRVCSHIACWNVRTLRDEGVQALTMRTFSTYQVDGACLSEVRLQLPTLPALLLQHRLRWFGHATSRAPDEFMRELNNLDVLRTWRKRIGGQLKTWATTLEGDLCGTLGLL